MQLVPPKKVQNYSRVQPSYHIVVAHCSYRVVTLEQPCHLGVAMQQVPSKKLQSYYRVTTQLPCRRRHTVHTEQPPWSSHIASPIKEATQLLQGKNTLPCRSSSTVHTEQSPQSSYVAVSIKEATELLQGNNTATLQQQLHCHREQSPWSSHLGTPIKESTELLQGTTQLPCISSLTVHTEQSPWSSSYFHHINYRATPKVQPSYRVLVAALFISHPGVSMQQLPSKKLQSCSRVMTQLPQRNVTSTLHSTSAVTVQYGTPPTELHPQEHHSYLLIVPVL